jgi:hypothetical protein
MTCHERREDFVRPKGQEMARRAKMLSFAVKCCGGEEKFSLAAPAFENAFTPTPVTRVSLG